MRLGFVLGAAVFGGMFTSASWASVVQGPVTNPANDHLYYLLSNQSWTSAESEAISLGGHLVTINDAAENLFVRNTFNPTGTSTLWIGLNDVDVEGTFVWSSGEPVTYTNFGGGEPNDGFGNGEDYVVNRQNGVDDWNDLDNNWSLGGVVEVVPEPTTLALLTLALPLLASRRRRDQRAT